MCGTGTVCIAGTCQSPWAVGVGGLSSNSYEESWSITQDTNGNTYVGGRFAGSTIKLGTTVLSHIGQNAIFVAKLDSNLNATQTSVAFANNSIVLRGLTTDKNGNLYAAGYFYGQATFGTTTLSSRGSSDIFVAQIDSNGKWSWVTQAGGTSTDQAFSVRTDQNGNSYIAGSFSTTATFGSVTLSSRGGYDIVVAKLDSTGSWQWATSAGGNSTDYAYDLALDSTGNIYVTGAFYTNSASTSFATFGTFSTIKANGSSQDIFVAKLNNSGSWVWVQTAGSTSTDFGYAITLDNAGNSYITGYAYSGAKFGSLTTASYGNSDIIVAKLDSNGTWSWAQTAGSTSNDYGFGISSDSTGNLYVTGYFYSSSTTVATFGSYTLKATGNSNDMFVAKLSNTGTWLWVTSGGGDSSDYGYSIITDTAGNSYVAGVTYSTNSVFGSFSLSNNDSGDIFVARLNNTGSFTHAVRWGGETSYEDIGEDVALDAQGNIYVIGSFYGSATFGSTTLTSEENSQDVFVGKLDPAGNWLWAKKAGSTYDDYGKGIKVDAASNVYITGYATGGGDDSESSNKTSSSPGQNLALIPSGAMVFGSFTLLTQNYDKMFVAKLDKDGNWLWAKNTTNQNSDYASSLAMDSSSNIYVTGYFYGNATFGTTTLSQQNSSETFVAKLDKDGNWLWAIQSKSTDTTEPLEIATDNNGDAYITGLYYGSPSFGTTSFSSAGNADIFVAKINNAGSWVWAKSAGGSSSDSGRSLAVDSAGNIFVTGSFQGSATFGSTTLVSSGSNDAFVAKMDKNGNWLWVKSASTTGNDIGYGITLDSSGSAYVTGSFSAQIILGTFTLTNTPGIDGIFVARIDTNGNWTWAQSATGTNHNYPMALTHGDGGKLYVTGRFTTSTKFGKTTLTSKGSTDIFVWQILP